MDKHDLLHEFPKHKDKIHDLKVSNEHFRKSFDDYHELKCHIQKINMGSERVIVEYAHELKAKLLFMKDEIFISRISNFKLKKTTFFQRGFL